MTQHDVFSAGWAAAWCDAINASDEYRAAAGKWEWPIVFALQAEPDRGIHEQFVRLDLWKGECREARVASGDDVATTPFVIRAPLDAWRDVLDGRLDPLAAIMTGRLKLEQGSMMTLAIHTASAKALVAAATRVATRFPEADAP
jgi:putative sterol carrier protein